MIASLLVWATGLPALIKYVHAANVTSFKDTLSDSDLTVLSKHTISFTTVTTIANGETIQIIFDPATSLFNPGFSSATSTDITTTGLGTPTITGTGNTGANEGYTITLAAEATAGAKTITIGAASTNLVTNPGSANSYVIRLAGTMTDKGDARVAIIDDVVVTASVDTTLTFTVSGVASGQTNANNGGITSTTTTATAIAWGTLETGATASSTARQDLSVTTNAKNGFTVTIVQDQNLTSSSGADIDMFKDGVDGSPAAWTAPTATLDSENTYGHEGITSEDSTLSGGDTFSTALFDTASTTPLEIFYHNGPADGTTADKGATKIGFKIQISALQEAGTDYTQSLTYIATPIF